MHQRSPFIVALLLSVAGAAAVAATGPAQPSGAATGVDAAQSATFQVFLQGVQVGTERAKVSRTGEGWLIAGTSALGNPVALTLRRAEIRYTADWQPVSLLLEGVFRGEPLQTQTAFSGSQAVNRLLRNGVPTEVTHAITQGAVALPNNFFAAYTGLAVRLATTRAGEEVKAYVAPQAEVGILLNLVTSQRMQTASRAFEVRQYRIGIRNPGATLDAELWAEPGGRLVRFMIPSASLDVVREDVASVAARLQTFHREGDVEVRVPSVGFSLAATVSPPPPAALPAGTKLPAIVLVAGSGAVDRDEVVAGIPIFGQLAAGLADAGFIVVRYDKRGVGQSGGRAESATLQDYAEDVRAVVRYASDRKDVDDRRIAVVGHSEGAWAALLAAAREDRIARVALLAAPATTGAELVLAQQRHLLERSSISDADRQAKIDLQKRIQAAVLGAGSWEGVPSELRKQADTPWFASFLAFDPAKVLPRVRQPLLIVQGELDRQVAPENAARLAEMANARKKAPPTEVVRLGVNHLFVPATTGEVEEYATLTTRQIDPRVVEAIVTFLKK